MPKIIATSQGSDRSGYDAESAHRMGMVNAVVPHADLENVGLEWAAKICGKSPTAQRMLKFAFNAIDDVLIGQQVFAGRDHATGVHDGRSRGRSRFPCWESGRRAGPSSPITTESRFGRPASAHGARHMRFQR